ncbi:MAG TPA: acyl-CoA dehydrogenase family protein [Aquihabitans sp.]|nr:acyl-CoA dehydrogenase family protein [Aquihabitans sp.]
MELELSEEQAFFAETTRRFLAAESGLEAHRALEHDALGFDPAVWQRGAELGWTSLLVDPNHGGGCLSEHGLLDLVLVAEEMGRVVAPGPLVPVNVVAAAVSAHGSEAQRAAVLPGLLDGTEVAAWCGTEPIAAVERPGGGWELTGTAPVVEAGAQAGHLLVAISTPAGPGQALVRAEAPGLAVTPLGGLDLVRRFAEVSFERVAVGADGLLGDVGPGAEAAIEHQLHVACTLQAAAMAGAMDIVLAMTVEYLGDRFSFGRPLSSYQALKHRVADLKVWVEAAHAIATGAARAVAHGSPDAADVVDAAQRWIGPRATDLVQDCIQLHGGIGVTWEHDLHLYLRRTTVDRATYGTPDDHGERFASRLLGVAS